MEKYLLSLLTEPQWKKMKLELKKDFVETITKEVAQEFLTLNWDIAVCKGWVIKAVHTNRECLGFVDFYPLTIGLNQDFFNERYVVIVNTILHEVAHALDYETRKTTDHKKEWYECCLKVGMTYASAYQFKYSRYRY
jgi:hypothetical protein